jgi:hypothetical protein
MIVFDMISPGCMVTVVSSIKKATKVPCGLNMGMPFIMVSNCAYAWLVHNSIPAKSRQFKNLEYKYGLMVFGI